MGEQDLALQLDVVVVQALAYLPADSKETKASPSVINLGNKFMYDLYENPTT